MSDVLHLAGFELSDVEEAGEEEKYVHAAVRGVDVEIWLYDDEAEIRVGRRHLNFEQAVYHAPDELARAFARSLQHSLETAEREQ